MSQARFLRNIVDGTIYDWNEILSVNPKCEEVTEEQAYPERFVRPEAVAAVDNPISLTTYIPPEPDNTPPELAADAARRFGIKGAGLSIGPQRNPAPDAAPAVNHNFTQMQVPAKLNPLG